MDSEALALQERLHRDNQERMKRVEDRQEAQIAALARIEENTKHLPDLDRRVDALERHKDEQHGALAVLSKFGGLIGVAVGAAVEWLFHHFSNK